MFEEGLATFLCDAGTSAGDRIYPGRLPQGVVLPAVMWFKVSAGIEYTQSGPEKGREPRYQLDCWAETYLEARTLAEEMIAALSGYRGAMGNEMVEAAFIEGDRDNNDPETGRHWASLDVILHHQ